MRRNKLVRAVALVFGLAMAGCASIDEGFRDLPQGEIPDVARDYRVAGFDVLVPQSLSVSEANLYYPIADIVWRDEPFGDRYAQVEAIFDEAGARVANALDGDRPVRVTVQVTRFHSVTEKARTQVGGVHSIRFYLTVYDVGSRTPIDGPRLVIADLPALGGEAGLWAERRGQTMRVRIVDHLGLLLEEELTRPVTPDAQG